jgi:hypothetical protein
LFLAKGFYLRSNYCYRNRRPIRTVTKPVDRDIVKTIVEEERTNYAYKYSVDYESSLVEVLLVHSKGSLGEGDAYV